MNLGQVETLARGAKLCGVDRGKETRANSQRTLQRRAIPCTIGASSKRATHLQSTIYLLIVNDKYSIPSGEARKKKNVYGIPAKIQSRIDEGRFVPQSKEGKSIFSLHHHIDHIRANSRHSIDRSR